MWTAMHKPRIPWSKLRPSTKNRYRKVGVHPNTYNAGKVPREVRDAARGHNSPLYRNIVHREPIVQSGQRSILRNVFSQGIGPQPAGDVQYLPTPGRHSNEVKQALAERMYRTFGQSLRYRGALDPDYTPKNYPPAPDDDEILNVLQLGDDDLAGLAHNASLGYQPQYWFLFYH